VEDIIALEDPLQSSREQGSVQHLQNQGARSISSGLMKKNQLWSED
jgi:hypothetical protein